MDPEAETFTPDSEQSSSSTAIIFSVHGVGDDQYNPYYISLLSTITKLSSNSKIQIAR